MRKRLNQRLKFEIEFGLGCAALGGVALPGRGMIHGIGLLLVGLAAGTGLTPGSVAIVAVFRRCLGGR